MISQCKAIKTAAKLVLFVELHKFLWNDYRAPLCFYPHLYHLQSMEHLEYLDRLDSIPIPSLVPLLCNTPLPWRGLGKSGLGEVSCGGLHGFLNTLLNVFV